MLQALKGVDKIPGHTVLLVDVSGSMRHMISAKSDITRMDAACGLAILLRELCEKVSVYSFSEYLVRIPSRRGFSLRDAIVNSQRHWSTYLGASVKAIYSASQSRSDGNKKFEGQNLRPDRLIAITDEQSNDRVPAPMGLGYMINVAAYKNGVGYGPWIHCDGWSEAVVSWISGLEREQLLF